jgi:hypothetical protein
LAQKGRLHYSAKSDGESVRLYWVRLYGSILSERRSDSLGSSRQTIFFWQADSGGQRLCNSLLLYRQAVGFCWVSVLSDIQTDGKTEKDKGQTQHRFLFCL